MGVGAKMLSKKDFLLMSFLRKNARQRLTKMSKQTKVPVSTIYDKLKVFEKGIIQKHTSLIDFSKIGFNARANIMLKVKRADREELKKDLMQCNNINSIYKINTGFDFMVEGVFRNIKDMEDFLEKLDDRFEIKERKVFYIIEDLKREGFLSDPNSADLIAE